MSPILLDLWMEFVKPLLYLFTQALCEIEHLISLHVGNRPDPFVSPNIPFLTKAIEFVNKILIGFNGICE